MYWSKTDARINIENMYVTFEHPKNQCPGWSKNIWFMFVRLKHPKIQCIHWMFYKPRTDQTCPLRRWLILHSIYGPLNPLNATTKPMIDRILLIWRRAYIHWTTIQQWDRIPSYYIGPIETSNYINRILTNGIPWFLAACLRPLDNDSVHDLHISTLEHSFSLQLSTYYTWFYTIGICMDATVQPVKIHTIFNFQSTYLFSSLRVVSWYPVTEFSWPWKLLLCVKSATTDRDWYYLEAEPPPSMIGFVTTS
jgi:hypothetical protein